MIKVLTQSLASGVAVTIGFFFLTFASFFLVTGHGTAPWITDLMLKLCEVPITLFGLPKDSLLGAGALFWGTIAFVGTFIALSTVKVIEPHPKLREAARNLLRTLLFLAVLALVFMV